VRGRSRTWRVLKSAGAVACLLIVALYAATGTHTIVVDFYHFDIGLLGARPFGDVRWLRAGRGWGGPWFRCLELPLVSLFALVAIPTAYFWWRDSRRVAPGYCQQCGYNLTGNVSGRCPECSAPVKRENEAG
jgi:hypothetical protein